MIPFLLSLLYFSTTLRSVSSKSFNYWSSLTYSFNKNSKVFINISDISTQIIFGLATNKEINYLKSIRNTLQSCKSPATFQFIQNITYSHTTYHFLITRNPTVINFECPSKKTLTPYAISCNSICSFDINVDFLNGKNHLDSRCQFMIPFTFISMIIFSISLVIYFILFFVYKRKKIIEFVCIFFFCVAAIVQTSTMYLFFSNNSKSEYKIDNENIGLITLEYFCYLISLFFYYLHDNSRVMIIVNILIFATLLICLFVSFLSPYKVAFYVWSVVYVLTIIFNTSFVSSFSLLNIAFFIFYCTYYFRMIIVIIQSSNHYPIIYVFMIIDMIQLIRNLICFVLMLIHYFYINIYKSKNYNELPTNFSYDQQRSQSFQMINTDIILNNPID